ncbi:MAG: four helix bundle protein [Chloracidobacterium sp.]|nr:four helix bundle protein [Chloracidobacterium sp.]
MANVERFEDLQVWKRAREVTRTIYVASSMGDLSRDFGLRDQLRRSSLSIMSNIAEGFERDGNREFINFLSIAKGSCAEARSQLYVALDHKYITGEQFELIYQEFAEIGRMIAGLIKYLKGSEFRGRKFI